MFVLDKEENIHGFDNYLNDEKVYEALEKYWMDNFFKWLDTENINKSDWLINCTL